MVVLATREWIVLWPILISSYNVYRIYCTLIPSPNMYDSVEPDPFSWIFLSPPAQLGYSLDEGQPGRARPAIITYRRFISCELYAWPVTDNTQYMYKYILLILLIITCVVIIILL